jgi:quercetin dioxygenase-like cupin family protein
MGRQESETLSQPFSFDSLAAYQTGSVVSRTIMNQKEGTVTIFAFDAGQSLSEHTAPYDALAQVVDGEGIFLIAGEPHRVSSGQAIIMPAQVVHSVRADKRFKMVLVMIRGSASDDAV